MSTFSYDDFAQYYTQTDPWAMNPYGTLPSGTGATTMAYEPSIQMEPWHMTPFEYVATPVNAEVAQTELPSTSAQKRKQTTTVPSRDNPSRPAKRPRQRINTNLKERRRNLAVNDAFNRLQSAIPSLPREQKLPKIKTLRIAIRYIEHLREVLAADFKSGITKQQLVFDPTVDFSKIVSEEVQAKNSYKERAEMELRYGSDEGFVEQSV